MKKIAATSIALIITLIAAASGPTKKSAHHVYSQYQLTSERIEKAMNRKLYFTEEKKTELTGNAHVVFKTDASGNAYLMEVDSENYNLEKFIRKQTFSLTSLGFPTHAGQRFEFNIVFTPQDFVK